LHINCSENNNNACASNIRKAWRTMHRHVLVTLFETAILFDEM
jgi:hypothetical protein